MDAGVDLWLPDFVVDFSSLNWDGVKGVHRDLSELLATVGNLVADRTIISHISRRQQSQYCQYPTKNREFHGFSHSPLRAAFTLSAGDMARSAAFNRDR